MFYEMFMYTYLCLSMFYEMFMYTYLCLSMIYEMSFLLVSMKYPNTWLLTIIFCKDFEIVIFFMKSIFRNVTSSNDNYLITKTKHVKKTLFYGLICCLGTYFWWEIIDESHRKPVESITSLLFLPLLFLWFYSQISSQCRLCN